MIRCIAILIPSKPDKKAHIKPILRKSDITTKSEYIPHAEADNDIVAQSHNAYLIAKCISWEITL